MTIFARIAAILAAILFSVPVWAAESLSGDLSGSFTANATDGSGSFTGGIEGRWTATASVTDTGVSVEGVTGSGSFGGLGLAGNWTIASYDHASKTIHVTWNGPGDRGPVSASGNADGSVALILDVATGTASGAFDGQVFTPSGVKTVSGTWTVRFQGLPNATASGQVDGAFSGTASYVGNVSGGVTGDWTVRILADGSITGTASGSYDGGNVTVAGYGTICICGTWTANLLQGEDGQYQLQGSWTHPVVSGNLAGSGGGPLVWYINVAASPMQASGSFSGQVTFTVSVPVIGTMDIPISVSGDWSATLPLNP
jgi:hypothetical protein